MNLYLISQDDRNDYDTYDSAVVAAETEEEAKRINPSGQEFSDYPFRGWASSPEKVTARLIGTAVEGTASGVILASYNAG